jgi:hypothetical protein
LYKFKVTNGSFDAYRVLMVNWAYVPEANEAINVMRAKNFMITVRT